jgi:hypothetical protein
MRLNESPDAVRVSDNSSFHWSDNNAYGFGFDYENNAYLSQEGSRHSDIKHDYEDAPPTRRYFEYPGRFWKKEKIISFWEYPSPYKLFPLLKKLEGEWKERFPNKKPLDFTDKNWRIEKWERMDSSIGYVSLENYKGFNTNDEYETTTHTAKLMDHKEKRLREIIRKVVRGLV